MTEEKHAKMKNEGLVKTNYGILRNKLATAIAQEKTNVSNSLMNLVRLGAMKQEDAKVVSDMLASFCSVTAGIPEYKQLAGVRHWGDSMNALPTTVGEDWPEDGDTFDYEGERLTYVYIGGDEGGGFVGDSGAQVWCYEREDGSIYWEGLQ